MATGNNQDRTPPAGGADTLKNWIMVVLTLAFVSLYGAALIGWLKPLADEKMVLRLEPIIFVIIGYYFGPVTGPTKREDTQRRDWPTDTESRRRTARERTSAAITRSFGRKSQKRKR